MNLDMTRMIGPVKHKLAAFTIGVLVLAVNAAVPAIAQDGASWEIDSRHSVAHLFLGSAANPEALEVGLAAVNGSITLDAADPSESVVEFTIYRGDQSPGTTSPEASGSELTFQSRRVQRMENGNWKIIGDLTLSTVKRSVTANPGEDYSGPVYDAPVVSRVTREVAFLLKTVAQDQKNRTLELSAWAVVGGENFRELLVSAQSAAWPNTLVQDEDCRMPATIGEDYAGPACTGKLIAAASSSEMPSNISEDYAGALQPVVQARQTVIRIVAVTQPASSLALTAKK